MYTPTNKNKKPSFSVASLNNPSQKNLDRLQKQATLTPFSGFDLSFTVDQNTRTDQTKTSSKIQSSPTLASTTNLQKRLSNPNIKVSQTSSWIFNSQAKEQSSLRREHLPEKNVNRLKTTETIESELVIEQNTEKQEYYSIKVTQPSIKESVIQAKQKLEQKQKQKEHSQNFDHSNNFLKPSAQPLTKYSSQNNLKASRAINDGRLKLKDYLFMVNTSTALAANKKRRIDGTVKLCPEAKKEDCSRISTTQKTSSSTGTSKKVIQKYRISNKQMYGVLRTEINTDIKQLKNKLSSIQNWLNETQTLDNQELVHLYDLRRQIQYYNQQIQTYCADKGKANTTAQESIVNIIHQYDEEEQLIEI